MKKGSRTILCSALTTGLIISSTTDASVVTEHFSDVTKDSAQPGWEQQ